MRATTCATSTTARADTGHGAGRLASQAGPADLGGRVAPRTGRDAQGWMHWPGRTRPRPGPLAPRIEMTPRFLAAAISKAQSTDPGEDCAATGRSDARLRRPGGMRGEDHQLLLPQVVNTIAAVDGKTVKVGWGNVRTTVCTDAAYTGNELAPRHGLQMARP